MNSPEDQPAAPGRHHTLLLVALLIIAVIQFVGATKQKKQIKQLQLQNQQIMARAVLDRKVTDKKIDELSQKIGNLELSGGTLPATNPKLDAVNVSDINNGLFTYTDSIQMATISGDRQSKFKKQYKVTVIKTQLGAGSLKMDFVIGLATCTGLPQFFVDYDGDKLVDLDIMHELVDSMPFGSLLSKKMNSNNSQNLYDSFLINHESADHLAASEIDDKGGALAKSLWKVITDQSEKITEWIQK